MTVSKDFLNMATKMFRYYKMLSDKSIARLEDAEIHFRPNAVSNNISIIVKHMSGNMLSRFTDFLTTDGEKEWRERDAEFEDTYTSKEELMAAWEKGWNCLFATMDALSENDLEKTVLIREEPHTVLDALTRQVAHYAYHAGQIVYIAKMIKNTDWEYLSIPPGKSKGFEGNFLK